MLSLVRGRGGGWLCAGAPTAYSQDMAGLAVGAFVVAAVAALVGVLAGGRGGARSGDRAQAAQGRAGAVMLLNVADLATGPRRGRVNLRGRVEPGPGGPLTAPLSGTPCVWWSTRVVEHWRELDRAFLRDLDGDGKLDRSEAEAAQRERSRTERATSNLPFTLRDATGAVLVETVALDPDGLHVSVRDQIGSERQGYFPDDTIPIERAGYGVGMAAGRSSSRYERLETVLVVGQVVSVSGELTQQGDGSLRISGRRVLVTTRQLADVLGGGMGAGSLSWLVAALATVIGVVALTLPAGH